MEGLPDINFPELRGDHLTKNEQEILESKHVTFILDGIMPGRFAASVQLLGFYNRFSIDNRRMQWAIVRAEQGTAGHRTFGSIASPFRRP